MIKMKAVPLFEVSGMNLNGSISGYGDGSPAGKLNGGGHYEALIVVSMLANEVDSSGRAIDPAVCGEQTVEQVGEVAREKLSPSAKWALRSRRRTSA